MTRSSQESGSPLLLALAALLVCGALVGISQLWPSFFSARSLPFDSSLGGLAGESGPAAFDPAVVELVKLAAAGLVGLVVTSVHRRYNGERTANRALMQAAVLLCISGALMMIIIGNSTARALGIAGGASIIRFRTPVEDPRDTILLFLVLGLGMALGLGAFAVCGLAALFLCAFLVLLDKYGDVRPRTLMLDLVSSTPEFPLEHVHQVLSANAESFEQMRIAQGTEPAMRFSVRVSPGTSLAWISNALMNNGESGLKSVSWEQPKKSEG
jgi:MFS family permease